jgi:hypothetical protein
VAICLNLSAIHSGYLPTYLTNGQEELWGYNKKDSNTIFLSSEFLLSSAGGDFLVNGEFVGTVDLVVHEFAHNLTQEGFNFTNWPEFSEDLYLCTFRSRSEKVE